MTGLNGERERERKRGDDGSDGALPVDKIHPTNGGNLRENHNRAMRKLRVENSIPSFLILHP